MREVLQDIRTEVRGAWRFRWPAMALAWLVCLVGWGAVLMMPDKYAAEAQFFVDPTSRIKEVLGKLVVDDDEATQLAFVREAMLSRPTLLQVARDTDLHLRARTPQESDELVDGLRRTVKIQSESLGGRRRNAGSLYSITFQDVDRQMSRRVVDSLLESFRKEFTTGQRGGTEEARRFLELKVAEYSSELRERDQEMVEFKRRYMGLLPGEGAGYFENMQAALGELQALESQLKLAVSRRGALREQLRGGIPDPGDDSGISEITTPRTELEERIVELEETLDALLLSFTERHPDVIATRTRMDQLYERRQRELEAMREAGGADVPVSDNPVVQELQIALNEADVEVRDLEAQVAAQRLRIADLQAKVDIVPQVEAELADLTRGYNQVKRTHEELLERLNQETLFGEKDEFEGSNFRIVQPPAASLEPVAPNRPRMFIAITFGGMLLAAGLAYLFHLMRPVFVDPRSLGQVTGLPVLGAVSMAWMSQQRNRRLLEVSSLAVAGVMLVVALVMVLVFQDAGVEAAARIKRMALL